MTRIIDFPNQNNTATQPNPGYRWNVIHAYEDEGNLGVCIDMAHGNRKMPIYEQAPDISTLITKIILKATGENIKSEWEKIPSVSETGLYVVKLDGNSEYVGKTESIDETLGTVRAMLYALEKRDKHIRESPLEKYAIK